MLRYSSAAYKYKLFFVSASGVIRDYNRYFIINN